MKRVLGREGHGSWAQGSGGPSRRVEVRKWGSGGTERSEEGALGRIRAEEILGAMALVREGRVFDLGTRLGGDMPKGPPGMFGEYRWLSHHGPSLGTKGESGFEYSMEVISASPHQSSHIDGLAHVQAEGRLFGGARAEDTYTELGWKQHGMETAAPIVGRGVLLDVPTALGVEQLSDGEVVDRETVEATLERQGTELRRGDIVLVRTGKIREYELGQDSYYGEAPGLDVAAGLWLYAQGMSVLGSDTSGTEPTPFIEPSRTLHRALLVERGLHLLEVLNLEELAACKVYEFLFVCCPLKIVGATGSWVRPIALI